jgi:XRE family transcriptional regulator, regulator of sulfur utilization
MFQQELADRIGVPKSTIGRIEAGLTSPRVETLFKISQALNFLSLTVVVNRIMT